MINQAKSKGNEKAKSVPTIWQLDDALWAKVEPLLPVPGPKKKDGRPRANPRKVLDGILYVLRSGCPWKRVPREFSSGSTVHKWFSEWSQAGVFEKTWSLLLLEYDEAVGIDWEWQSMDGCLHKASGVPKKGRISRQSGLTRRIGGNPAQRTLC